MTDNDERIPTPSEESAREFARSMTGSDGDLYVEAVMLRDALIAGRAYHEGYVAGLELATTIVHGSDALAEAERVIKEINRGN